MKLRFVGTLIALFALVSGATWTAMAQTATGQITGVVKDANGAVLAKARVKVDSALTGLARETTTNEEGIYVFPLLPVGVYAVTVEHQGFSTAKKANISINVDQIVRADFDLKVGDVTAVVEVEAGAVALDTETASIGQVVSQRQVTQLPLNGRNFLQLLFLNGGTVETDGEQGRCDRAPGTRSASTARGRPRTTTCSTEPRTPTPLWALRRLSCQLTPFRSSRNRPRPTRPSTASAPTRSTSSVRPAPTTCTGPSSGLGAMTRWTPTTSSIIAPATEKNKLRQNQFGFVAGGPVIIPKLYDGRNKTFWLVNFEG